MRRRVRSHHWERNRRRPQLEQRKVKVMKAFVVKSSRIKRLALLALMVGVLGGLPTLSAAPKPSTAVTIVNNTSIEIRHVYLSATTDNNWGSDQLTTAIAVGGSQAVNLSCSGSEIKVIAEDEDGCFYYEVASCSENSTWTISNSSARDCGN